MLKSVFLRLILHSAFVLSCAIGLNVAVPTVQAAESTRPNVVMIVIDNVDFSYMGKCYEGDGLTPHMDRISESGVKFTRAYAVTPLCVPSRYTCLSGRYASRAREMTEAESDDDEGGPRISLETQLPNVPNVLKKTGYATGFVGKYHLESEKYKRFQGNDGNVFSHEADRWLKTRNDWLTERIKQRGFEFVFDAIDFRSSQFRGIDFDGPIHNPEAEVQGALEFIEQNKEQPFFLYFASQLLHLPIDPKVMLRDYAQYGRVTEGGLLSEAPKVPMPARQEIYRTAKNAGAKTVQQFGMHWLDCAIGAIVGRLQELKLADNTLFIVFSDNNQRGKETLYEGGARVPLLIMWPQRITPNVCNRIVANIDFAPTIFDACQVNPPPEMILDGRSVLPILADPMAQWRDGLLLENGHTRAVVTDDWKYVALRYPEAIQAKIEDVERTGKYPRLSRKADIFFEKFKKTLTPQQWNFARNSYRWHTQGNNYMKSIDDFPFQFDPDQLFRISFDSHPQDTENVASVPEHSLLLLDMKEKLTSLLKPLNQSFGEFGKVVLRKPY